MLIYISIAFLLLKNERIGMTVGELKQVLRGYDDYTKIYLGGMDSENAVLYWSALKQMHIVETLTGELIFLDVPDDYAREEVRKKYIVGDKPDHIEE
jgi:hypothetical protein